MGLEPSTDKWRAFGFNVLEVDGHSFRDLSHAVDTARAHSEGPTVVIAKTVKGKGIDFMENDVRWHYGGLDTDLIEKAKASVDRMVASN
jgi:transketolase